MAITFACPACGESYTVHDSSGGKSIDCRHCHRAMRVPMVSARPAAVQVVAAKVEAPPEAVERPREEGREAPLPLPRRERAEGRGRRKVPGWLLLVAIAGPLLAACLVVAVLLVGNYLAHRIPDERKGEEAIRIDHKLLAQELKDNRTAAESKYVGKIVEVQPSRITVQTDDKEFLLAEVSTGEAQAYVCFFFFADEPSNQFLRSAESGPFTATIRGKVSFIDDRGKVWLNPTWVVKAPPRR